jgi:MFS family permease
MKGFRDALNPLVVLAAFGYFVDIYDLILFGIVRNPSLTALGYSGNELTQLGIELFNWQMGGMLLGGIFWGILGDKKGRVSVLFGSIFLYSAANILNGMVYDILTYKVLRFLAGIGLAGELGAGITLVVESMDKETRGWGTMIVVTFGALGAVVAVLVGDLFDWRVAYFVGGALGIVLLFFRMKAFESGMFTSLKSAHHIKRGNFLDLINQKQRAMRYLACTAIGLPIWFTIGILVVLAPEFSKELAVSHVPKDANIASRSVMLAYIGLSFGDLLSGYLSQIWRSRKKVVLVFLAFSLMTVLLYLGLRGLSYPMFLFLVFALGTCTGYWGTFVTIASEQFGVNLRATATTTIPNFVRGAVIPITLSFQGLNYWFGSMIISAAIVGIFCLLLAFVSILYLKDTFGKDLNFTES